MQVGDAALQSCLQADQGWTRVFRVLTNDGGLQLQVALVGGDDGAAAGNLRSKMRMRATTSSGVEHPPRAASVPVQFDGSEELWASLD